MLTKVQRWGSSLGVRIPKPLAAEIALKEGATVDLSVEDGRIVVRPLRGRKYTLSALLSKVRRWNVHNEVWTE